MAEGVAAVEERFAMGAERVGTEGETLESVSGVDSRVVAAACIER